MYDRVRPAARVDASKAEDRLTRGQLRTLSTAAIVAMVIIILAATLRPNETAETFAAATGNDICLFGVPCTVMHGVIFAPLGVAMAARYASSDAARRSPRRVLLMMVLALWVFAAGDELVQERWIEGRDGELADWAADLLGAIVGLLAGGFLLRLLFKRPQRS